MSSEVIDFSHVEAAAKQIEGFAVKTPLLSNRLLDESVLRQVFIKPETLQLAGSFKFRGAYNRISRLEDDERRAGVIAWSSGNHAQGVAAAAGIAGVRARIVMPADAPRIKVENTLALGGEVIHYDRYSEDREAISYKLAEEEGGVIVPSYDDPHIMAGQGTTGREIFMQLMANNEAPLDALLVCCGGGGLTAGCAIAAEALSPNTDMYAVEPEGYDDHLRSLTEGEIVSADTSVASVCDALLSPQPGKLTFPINRRLLKGVLVVTEAEVFAAMRYAFNVLKLVVEPGGAVALAALLAGKLDAKYQRVGIVLSGGNVDPELFERVLIAS